MKSEILENGRSPQQKWTDSIQGTHIKSDSTNQPVQVQDRRDHKQVGQDHQEGELTKAIEKETSKIPSGAYLALAIGSMVLSASFAAFSKRKDVANFVGLWAPSILMLGLYNKIVKTHGSDRQTPA